MRIGRRSLALIVAVVAIACILGLAVVMTPRGAAVIAHARCAGQWFKSDSAAYQACFDVEREQILEDRARRHTRFDE